MNGATCCCCRKPMGNSLSYVMVLTVHGEFKMPVHLKCQKGKCKQCFYMMWNGKTGTCIECRNKVGSRYTGGKNNGS